MQTIRPCRCGVRRGRQSTPCLGLPYAGWAGAAGLCWSGRSVFCSLVARHLHPAGLLPEIVWPQAKREVGGTQRAASGALVEEPKCWLRWGEAPGVLWLRYRQMEKSKSVFSSGGKKKGIVMSSAPQKLGFLLSYFAYGDLALVFLAWCLLSTPYARSRSVPT